jgi:predicted enzyme related to lactoylglutathione lyase
VTINGLYTAVYRVPDLARAKAWYSAAFGVQPYFDEPFYVGFTIAGCELGLDPDPAGGKAGPGGVIAYWGVPDIEAAVHHFTSVGGVLAAPVQDVGEGIRVATIADPFGNHVGLIQNPHFNRSQA